jgi:hypothetical protein
VCSKTVIFSVPLVTYHVCSKRGGRGVDVESVGRDPEGGQWHRAREALPFGARVSADAEPRRAAIVVERLLFKALRQSVAKK